MGRRNRDKSRAADWNKRAFRAAALSQARAGAPSLLASMHTLVLASRLVSVPLLATAISAAVSIARPLGLTESLSASSKQASSES